MTVLLSFSALVTPSLLWTTSACSDERVDERDELIGKALGLLQAEELDTVSLDRTIHFITPSVTDTVASPETYQVLSGGQGRLKLVSLKTKRVLNVDALNTNHTEDIATPIALYVRDDEKFPHVVLLLPGGKALEAVGSYDVIRSRSLRTFQLTPIQIHGALKKKLQIPR
jgi:hypothetical protein